MKIDITKDEYKCLLDILYISDWVMNAFSVEERDDTRVYRDLEQKLLSLADGFGLGDLVDLEGRDEIFPSRKFEDESPAFKFIKEYDGEVFWDGLIERLAKRDFLEKHGKESLQKIFKDEELFNELEDMRVKYHNEFVTEGLRRLKILTDPLSS
ncbi:MAG TPA: hypothetical protein VFD57_06955 [Clostridia bacterium]|nr:hypothetical protein [Clostridia bacterium]